MVRTNAMSAAGPWIAWSSISAWAPRGQATPSAETQRQIRIGLAILDLAACRRLAPWPADILTAGIRGLDSESAAIESVPEHVRHVVPDGISVQIVAEDCLADIGLENAILDSCDLEGNSSGRGVAMERLAVRLVLADDDLVADATTHGPKINGLVALVGDDCTANRLCGASDEGQGSECSEEHSDKEYFE